MAGRYSSAGTPFGVIDLGSSRLACLIAEPGPDGLPNLLGQAIHAAEGIRAGEITDMSRFATALGRTVDAAERSAGITINTIHIVTPAGQPQLLNQLAEIDLGDTVIGRRELRRLAARQSDISAPPGSVVCQRQISEYLIDGLGQISNPRGMTGKTLAVAFSELTLSQASHANLCAAVQHNHLSAGQLYHSAAAAGLSCLSDDDRELGTLLIDCGGGTTGLCLYSEGRLRHVSTIRMGGQNITRDIAKMLSISTADAERLKAIEGTVMPAFNMLAGTRQQHVFPARGDNFVLSGTMREQDTITLASGQTIARAFLSDIIRTRIEEIFEAVDGQLLQSGLRPAASYNLVLTGGASQLTGLCDLATAHWQKPVQIKSPQIIPGYENQIAGASFAAAVGMAIFVQHLLDTPAEQRAFRLSTQSMFGRLQRWFKENL